MKAGGWDATDEGEEGKEKKEGFDLMKGEEEPLRGVTLDRVNRFRIRAGINY